MSCNEEEHVVSIDASCSCGAEIKGLWSGNAADEWAEGHEHDDDAVEAP